MIQRRLAIASLLVGGCCGAAARATDDLKELQGRWQLVYAEDGHGLAKSQGFVKYTMVIDGKQMAREFDDGRVDTPRPFSIAANRTPKQIDFSTGGKPAHDRVGIYSIEGDTLRICFSTVSPPEESRRPKEFTTPTSSDRVQLVFRRDGRDPNSRDRSSKLLDLLTERRDALQSLVAIMKQRHREGQVEFDEVLRASSQLLEAELELASTHNERIAILELQVKNFEELEEIVTMRWQNGGDVTRDKVYAAKASRLGAQIVLLRELEWAERERRDE